MALQIPSTRAEFDAGQQARFYVGSREVDVDTYTSVKAIISEYERALVNASVFMEMRIYFALNKGSDVEWHPGKSPWQ